MEKIKSREAVELLADTLPTQLCRVNKVSPYQADKIRQAFATLKAQTSETVLVTATYENNPWMLLRLTVPMNKIGFEVRKLRLSSITASFLRPGFGLLLEAGEPGLEWTDFEPGDLSRLRVEFGCVVIRGMKNAFATKDDLLGMTEPYGFAVPWKFGEVHVVKPLEDTPSDTQSLRKVSIVAESSFYTAEFWSILTRHSFPLPDTAYQAL